ncbi:MAG: alanine racemase [Symbiobacteriaceae bacterium]|nr:alanine racemase [Symbiobacteriaceae bacterium]
MNTEIGFCNSYLEVNLDAIAENLRKTRRHIGPGVDLIPVLKGNAYGLGLVEIARFLVSSCEVTQIGNAQVFESLSIREAGIECDLMVIGGVPFNNIPAVVNHDLITPAYEEEYLRLLDAEAARCGKKARVEIKVETGLNRIGVWPGESMDHLLDLLATLEHLQVIGAFTHFAEADAVDKSFTREQLAVFREGVQQIKARGYELPFVHAYNTAAVVWLRDEGMTHIRAGGLIYGYDSNQEPLNALGLEEAATWRAFVTNVKMVAAGEAVGYSRAFRAQRPTKVATISAGYGDGYARHLAAFCGAEMLVNGRRAKVIGTCMDQTFLDVTDIEVKMNDQVTLLGRDGDEFISVFEWQRLMGQTYLAVLANVAQRVKRIYIGGVKS